VGIEIDDRMIQRAREKLSSLPPAESSRIEYHHGDIGSYSGTGFDLALALFNVVSYLPALGDVHSFFQGVAQRLKPGAPFLFDAWNGVAAILDPPGSKETKTETKDEVIQVRLSSKTDFMNLRTDLTYDFEIKNRREGSVEHGHHAFSQTLWPPMVLKDAAQMAGFKMLGMFPLSDFSRAATERDWKVMFHCLRAGKTEAKGDF
jgi:SAM-dependent methyltransferase